MKLDESFWHQSEPRFASDAPDALRAWVGTQPELEGHVLFKTSGTFGPAKWVCLSLSALRASALAVNTHLKANSEDVWLNALPTEHIGGFSIHTRALLSQSAVHHYDSRWEPSRFCQFARECGTTLTSLVPTQVHDLVVSREIAPSSLRAVLVGGGALRLPAEPMHLDGHSSKPTA